MRTHQVYILSVITLVTGVPVAEEEKRYSAEFDYVIIGVSAAYLIRL